MEEPPKPTGPFSCEVSARDHRHTLCVNRGIPEVFFSTAPEKGANTETGAEDGNKVKLHDVL